MARNARIGTTKVEMSRNGRHLGGVLAACVVVAAAVFALGLQLGRRKEQPPAALPADRLTLLDDVERMAPPTPPPAKLVFHDALTKDRPPDTLPTVPARAAAKPIPARQARVAPGTGPATGPETATGVGGAGAVAARAEPVEPRAALATPARVAVPSPGGWAVQLGASPNEPEANRLAARHPGARVVTADVDGKRWYRVRLAGFGSRADAQQELERLGRDSGARGFVTAAH